MPPSSRIAALPLALLLLLLAPVSQAAEDESVSRRVGNDLFQAGGDIRFDGEVPGDALIAGGEIDFEGTASGDAAVAGGRVRITGSVGEDLYLAGGRVRLDGRVTGSARVAGGDVTLSPNAFIGEGLTVAGGRIDLEGHAARYAQIAGGEIRINGRIDGNVEVAGDQLVIGPDAVIGGRVTFRGARDAQVSPGARIDGGVENVRDERAGWRDRGWRTIVGTMWAVWFVGWLIVGILLLMLLPAATRAITGTIRAKPGMTLLLGFALLIAVPAAIVLAAVSVVGIPLALLLLLAYLALLPLGYLASIATLGDWLLPRLRRGDRPLTRGLRIGAFVLALIAVFLVTRIPVIGGIISFALVLFGIGGVILAATRYRQSAAPAM